MTVESTAAASRRLETLSRPAFDDLEGDLQAPFVQSRIGAQGGEFNVNAAPDDAQHRFLRYGLNQDALDGRGQQAAGRWNEAGRWNKAGLLQRLAAGHIGLLEGGVAGIKGPGSPGH